MLKALIKTAFLKQRSQKKAKSKAKRKNCYFEDHLLHKFIKIEDFNKLLVEKNRFEFVMSIKKQN